MLFRSFGVDVGDRMYLVRMHEDRDSYELVHCRDLRKEALHVLQAEEARLAKRRVEREAALASGKTTATEWPAWDL